MPKGNRLSTDILDRRYDQERASKMDQFDAYADMGRTFTIACDHWEYGINNHLIGVMIQTINRWINFDDGKGEINACDKNNATAIAGQLEKIICAVTRNHPEYNIRALCTTDIGQFAAARRILALRYPHWVFTRCIAHQINLMLKDALNIINTKAIVRAVMIEKTFHQIASKWLHWLRRVMHASYKRTTTIPSFAEQRWESMQALLASFLRIRSAMHRFHSTYSDMKDYPACFTHLGNTHFWHHIQQAERILRPLTELSFRMQKSNVFLSDIIYMYGRLYRQVEDNITCCSHFRQVLENRFREEEHPLLLLTFCLDYRYFDLYIQLTKASNHTMLHSKFLCQTAVYYYKKFLGQDYVEADYKKLVNQMLRYLHQTSNDSEQAQNIVYPFDYWWLNENQEDQLCQLAKFLLSIVTQTATCERLFSHFDSNHAGISSTLSSSRIYKLQELNRLTFEDYQTISNIKSKLISSKELKLVTTPDNSCFNDQEKVSDESENDVINNTCAEQPDEICADTYSHLLESWIDALSASEGNHNQDDTDSIDDLCCEEKSEDSVLLAQNAIQQIKFDDGVNIRKANAIPTWDDKNYPQEKLGNFRSQKIRLQDLFDNAIFLPYIT